MRPPRLLIALLISLAALLAAGLTLVSADEDAEETPELQTITLHPGDNFVGWVGQAAPVEDLLEAVPQIELVYAWDAGWERYRYAAPASLLTVIG